MAVSVAVSVTVNDFFVYRYTKVDLLYAEQKNTKKNYDLLSVKNVYRYTFAILTGWGSFLALS